MSKPYDLAIFIGRMAPCHFGHVENIEKASSLADDVLILFGSSNAPADQRNPFSYHVRKNMVQKSIAHLEGQSTFWFRPLNDIPSDDLWAGQVTNAAREVLGYELDDRKIALVGHKKDESSFYLDMFPTWEFIETGGHMYGDEEMAATRVRECLFEGRFEEMEPMLSAGAYEFLVKNWVNGGVYPVIKEEYDYHKAYPAHRRQAYPINDVTADAVVLCSGHILLIRRKNVPGKGLLALPGGFVQTNETVQDGAVRELIEETRLHVPEKVIRGSIVDEHRFDKPNRSLRGRIMTFAFTIQIQKNPDGSLPRVYGADDAEKAFWVPIADIMAPEAAGNFFEDHHNIIMTMIGRQA